MIFFRHNSRVPGFRVPYGAVHCAQPIRIEAELGGDDSARVTLRLWLEGSERLVPMTREGESGRLHADFTAPEHPGLVWYWFIIQGSDGQTRYYGAESGEGSLCMHEPPSWQITVFDPAFTTPDWYTEGIAYQIFPDRFHRSSWEDFRARAQYHTGLGRFLRLHDRWSESPCFDAPPGKSDYTPDDFFGGDLTGIREKLPYLASLGVTVLYLNPIFESASNHRYDTADYLRIDPILGSEADFAALCAEAQKLGIRLMLDGVFSHTGADSRYFDREHRYETVGACDSQDSPYYSWYSFSEYPTRYSCWWNFPSLPNVDEMNPSYREFLLGDAGVLAHWANGGATSWRLDVADELPDDFIRALRRRVKQNDPDGVLLGEVWEDCSTKLGPDGRRRAYVDGDLLDGAMNYPFANAVIGFLTGRIDGHGLGVTLETQRERYPTPFYAACLNLIGSHDTVRAVTALSGAPDRNALPVAQQASYAPSSEDAALGRRRLILAAAIQMAMPGVPCIYYGDEIGMSAMADPFNRAPYPWGRKDTDMLAAYRLLTGARHTQNELKRGYCRMGALNADVFCIVRYTEDATELTVALINRSRVTQTVSLDPRQLEEGPDAMRPIRLTGMFVDILSGETIACTDVLTTTIPPVTAKFYTR